MTVKPVSPDYTAAADRYDGKMPYNRSGRSGLKIPAISIGLWHNFSGVDPIENSRAMLRRAFDLGITHFDIANNYGPPYGSAEESFAQIYRKDFVPYRDELLISTKAGFDMWPGPYGDFGSRKYLIASLDQSLKRMGLDYVDIFYHHRPDPETPLEETMGALDQIVRSGKALYVGISNYNAELTRKAAKILRDLGTPCLINQVAYNMLHRWVEADGLVKAAEEEGVGLSFFSPLAQGRLTDRYLHGIPDDSRAGKDKRFLRPENITPDYLAQATQLNEIAKQRGQTLAEMSLAWVLRHKAATTALIGASSVAQIEDDAGAMKKLGFTDAELDAIEAALKLKA
ncbi:MAG: L-glyceraldehyde 3-phosphate reductase [Chloroflexi bacterium]|nr:L-glyceraldehyde 3-phosphate reductase [Chloroflexota bacterium]